MRYLLPFYLCCLSLFLVGCMSTVRPDIPVPTPPPAPVVLDAGDADLIWLGRWIKVISAGAFALSTVLSFIAPVRAALGGGLIANVAVGGLVGTGIGLLIQKAGNHSSLLAVAAFLLVVLPLACKAWRNRKKAKRIASDLGVDRRQLFKLDVPEHDEPGHHRELESPQHHPSSPSPSSEESGCIVPPHSSDERKHGRAEAGVSPQIRDSEQDT